MNFARAVLIAAAAMSLLIPGASCNDENHSPVITSMVADADSVMAGDTIGLYVTADDVDGDLLSFQWQANSGELLSSDRDSISWVAPSFTKACTLTVTVSDDNGGSADSSVAVWSYVTWRFAEASGMTVDSTLLPKAAATSVPFIMEHSVTDGAYIDSLLLTTDLEPDTLGEQFQVRLVSPSGSEVLIFDGRIGEPDVSDFRIQGIQGEAAKGSWSLLVTRGESPIQRWCALCKIRLFYRY